MTRDEAIYELQKLLETSRSCKFGYPMDISDEHMLENVIAYLRADQTTATLVQDKETK